MFFLSRRDNVTNQPPFFLKAIKKNKKEIKSRPITLGSHFIPKKEPDLRWSQSVATEQNVKIKKIK